MRTYFQTQSSSDCSGCSACMSACPKKCIKLKPNIEGFLYPIKDQDKCINCGVCEKICPWGEIHKSSIDTITPQVYAAYDSRNRDSSSSGGIFYTIAKHIIQNKQGWVYGAAFVDKFQLCHIGVNTIEDLQKLRGSKYLQSDIGDTFRQIKHHLLNGEYVFFVGTPCQVAGLKAFLRNKNTDLLLCADLICHGVPSQYVFDEHVKYLETKHKAKLINYQFRNNARWGGCEIAEFTNPQKKIVLPSYDLSLYLYSFMHSYTYRESCYNCKYTTFVRQGDITLADYWGVRMFFPRMDYRQGVSLLIVNNDKGQKIWEKIKHLCVFEKSNLNDASKYNWNLNHVSKRPLGRDYIYDNIRKQGYEKTMNSINRRKKSLFYPLIIRIRECPFIDDIIYYIRKLKWSISSSILMSGKQYR